MRQHFFIRVVALSVFLLVIRQISGVFLAWRLLPLTEMPLIVLVFMVAIGAEQKLILLAAGITGIFLDFWSASGFGINAPALTLTVFFSARIFQKMLTNKNAVALILLGAAATWIYRFLIFLFTLDQFLKEPELVWRVFVDSAWRGGLNTITHSIILLLLFAVSRLFSKRLHPNYIRTT